MASFFRTASLIAVRDESREASSFKYQSDPLCVTFPDVEIPPAIYVCAAGRFCRTESDTVSRPPQRFSAFSAAR